MGTINISSLQKSDVFIVFDRIIKDPDFFIFKKIMSECDMNRFNLGQFIGFPEVMKKRLIIGRTEENLFKWLMKEEFDYESEYNEIYYKYPDMYADNELLNIGKSLFRLSKSYLIDNIYIWNEKYDKRQALEIASLYSSSTPRNIIYCKGKYMDVINSIPNIHTIFDWNIERLTPMIQSRSDIMFAIPRYGFNYVNTEDGDLILKNDLDKYKNVGVFDILDLSVSTFFG